MAYACVMTFEVPDPGKGIRAEAHDGRVYLYWQTATYVSFDEAETRQAIQAISDALAELTAQPQRVVA